MEALLMGLIVAIVICAVIWVVADLIVQHVAPAVDAWLVRLVAVLLIVLVLLRLIWPHI